MKPDTPAALGKLVEHLRKEVRYLEQSRLLHVAPAERYQRIRQLESWIAAIQDVSATVAEGDKP